MRSFVTSWICSVTTRIMTKRPKRSRSVWRVRRRKDVLLWGKDGISTMMDTDDMMK